MASGSASVENIILAAQNRIAQFTLEVNAALSNAQKQVADLGFGDVVWDPIVPLGDPSVGNVPTVPDITAPELNLPDAPGSAPTLQDIPTIPVDNPPQNKAKKPTLDFGTQPAALADAPDRISIDTSFDPPVPPSALSDRIEELEKFQAHKLPETPKLIIPEFTTPDPKEPDAPPKDGEKIMARNMREQSVSMRDNINAWMKEYIELNGPDYFEKFTRVRERLDEYLDPDNRGTGLKKEVEDAIYARARSKNDAEARRVRDQALVDAATRGFTIPTGAMMSAVQQARQAGADNNARAAAEIVVMQAELEQKHLQFAMTSMIAMQENLRTAATGYATMTLSIIDQAKDYAKSAFANTVALYNASLAFYSAQIEVFKTRATIFQSQLQAELAKLEVFKGEVAAFEALNQADKTLADVYSARLAALNSLAAAYKSKVDAAIAKTSMQKLKLEVFQAEVQAFGAQAQVKNAEWSGYSARLSGEESRARMYASELAAYNSELEAFKTTIAAKTAEIDMISKTNQSRASNYDIEVRAYVAQVGAESTRSNAQNENNRIVVVEFQKAIAAFMADVNLKLEVYKVQADALVKNATGGLSAQVELAHAKSNHGSTIAQLSTTGAQVYGQLLGSAMAGMNTLAAVTESA